MDGFKCANPYRISRRNSDHTIPQNCARQRKPDQTATQEDTEQQQNDNLDQPPLFAEARQEKRSGKTPRRNNQPAKTSDRMIGGT